MSNHDYKTVTLFLSGWHSLPTSRNPFLSSSSEAVSETLRLSYQSVLSANSRQRDEQTNCWWIVMTATRINPLKSISSFISEQMKFFVLQSKSLKLKMAAQLATQNFKLLDAENIWQNKSPMDNIVSHAHVYKTFECKNRGVGHTT